MVVQFKEAVYSVMEDKRYYTITLTKSGNLGSSVNVVVHPIANGSASECQDSVLSHAIIVIMVKVKVILMLNQHW